MTDCYKNCCGSHVTRRPRKNQVSPQGVRSREGNSVGLVAQTLSILPLLFLIFTPFAQAQFLSQDFEVDVVAVRNEDGESGTRIDVYTRVPIIRVSFINTPDGFTAGYQIKLDAVEWSDNDRLRNLVESKIWEANLVVDSYSETQLDNRFDFTTQSISLEPGRYLFEFELSDRNSNQTYLRSIPVMVRALDGDIAISDITLLDSYDETDFTIVPRVSSRVGSDEGGFQVFYEVYSAGDRDVTITQEIRRTREDGTATIDPQDVSDGEVVETDLVFTKEELASLTSAKSQYIVTVPMDDFRVGTYSIRVTISGLTGDILDTVERRFVVQWNGLDAHIQDIDDAIAQLEYMAERRELSFILDAPNQVERLQRFQNFWNKRDPTPGTKRNERMEEYYYRIAAANQNYGAVREGWKTDRGYVLVRFGEPDHVRKKPHSFDYEPYEIWEYQRIGRQFVFIDKTGFGDFQLLNPVWDERTRLY